MSVAVRTCDGCGREGPCPYSGCRGINNTRRGARYCCNSCGARASKERNGRVRPVNYVEPTKTAPPHDPGKYAVSSPQEAQELARRAKQPCRCKFPIPNPRTPTYCGTCERRFPGIPSMRRIRKVLARRNLNGTTPEKLVRLALRARVPTAEPKARLGITSVSAPDKDSPSMWRIEQVGGTCLTRSKVA